MNKLLVKDLEQAVCGLDIYDKYGNLTDVYEKLLDFISISKHKDDLDSEFQSFVDKNFLSKAVEIKKDTEIIIFDKNGNYYDPKVVAQIDLEIALNQLLWDIYETRKSVGKKICEHCERTLNELTQSIVLTYNNVVRFNECCCINNKEFAHLHFKLTD